MSKNISKNKSTILSSKYSQKILDHAKQSATGALKTASKRAIERTEEATGDLIGNNIANKITRASKASPKTNTEMNKEETLRERYISLELRQKNIDDLRLKDENYWCSAIDIIMVYQKIINLLDNKPNQPSKFRTKNWVEVNDELCGMYNVKSQIKLKLQC